MTRAPFTGPVVSQGGFAVGTPDDELLVIDSDGVVYTEQSGTFTGDFTGDLTGDVTGDVTGNVTGNVTGDVTGNVTGNVIGDVGSTASPANFYGYAAGAFLGNAAFPVVSAFSEIDEVPSGYFQFFYSSTGALGLATSTGLLGTISITT